MFSKVRNITLLRYFLSYFLIVFILMTGFLFIAKGQFESTYNKNLNIAAEEQFRSIKDTVDGELLTLFEIHRYLESNDDFSFYRHTGSKLNRLHLAKRMNEYITTNRVLSSINIINLSSGEVISSGVHIFKRDGYFEFIYRDTHIPFYPEKYLDSKNEHQIVFLEKEGEEILIYLPKSSFSDYMFLYILNITDLSDILSPASNSGIVSVCLLDKNNNIVAGYCPEILQSYVNQLPMDETYHAVNSNESIYTSATTIGNGALAAVISNEEIVSQVQDAMRNTYLLIMVLAFLGFCLMLYAMKNTFLPLHRLVKRFVPAVSAGNSYTELLQSTFSEMTSKNQSLQYKLDSYRLFMQKSIFNAVVSERVDFSEEGRNLDHIFEMDAIQYIMVVKILNCNRSPDFYVRIQEDMKNHMPERESLRATMIEQKEEYAVFLLCYMNNRPLDSELEAYFNRMYMVAGCRTVVSDVAESPLEIPSLYINIAEVSEMLSETPVILCKKINEQISSTNNLRYPFELLEELLCYLRSFQFYDAKNTIEQMFELLNRAEEEEEYFTDFFVRCVLIDILTTLANVINEMNIKFQNYDDKYFQALYVCRSGSYIENRETIHAKIMEVFHIYEEYSAEASISKPMIQEVMERRYGSPEFSIAELTDILRVSSVPYMSMLFKKKMEMTFSEYLWKMRLDRAKELLLRTDMNIEQIGVSVGYVNVSSFRRKFKQELKMTPSEYRERMESSANDGGGYNSYK